MLLGNPLVWVVSGTSSCVQNKFDWQAEGFGERVLISYGPCQFPTLGLIVQRAWCASSRCVPLSSSSSPCQHVGDVPKYLLLQIVELPAVIIASAPAALCREIQSHVKEDFWEIVVNYREEGGRGCTFHWNRGRLFDLASATILYMPCLDDPLATVIKVRYRHERSRRTLPDHWVHRHEPTYLASVPNNIIAS